MGAAIRFEDLAGAGAALPERRDRRAPAARRSQDRGRAHRSAGVYRREPASRGTTAERNRRAAARIARGRAGLSGVRPRLPRAAPPRPCRALRPAPAQALETDADLAPARVLDVVG